MTALAAFAPVDMAALDALAAGHAAPLHFLAGGTDMLIAGRSLPDSGLLVDVSRIAGIDRVDTGGADIRIGAAATVATLAEHRGLAERLPALCQAAARFGSAQIRNRATIGGNIANGAPAADLVPVLLAAEAKLLLRRPDGCLREAALAGHVASPAELIVEVILPSAGLRSCSAFVKLGPRLDLAISRLSLAMVADVCQGRFGELRLVAGAIGPVPRRLFLAEAALAGRGLDASTLRGFVSVLAGEVDAAIAGRASQPYKRRAIAGLGLDLVARLAGMSPRERLFEQVLE